MGDESLDERLEHVGQEMMSPVVATIGRIVIVPLTVVDRNLHLRNITVVEAIAAAIVLVAVKVLWIVDVRVMVEPSVVSAARRTTPTAPVGLLLTWLLSFRNGCGRHASHERDGCD